MRRTAFNKAVAGIAIATSTIGLACAMQGCGSTSPSNNNPYAPQTPADQLQADTGVSWIFETDPTTGAPSLVGPLAPIQPTAVNGVSNDDAARAFLDKYKTFFGLKNVASELALMEVRRSGDGTWHVRYNQTEGGLSVDRNSLTVHFLADGSISMINGRFYPNAAAAVGTPSIDANAALSAADADLATAFPGYSRASLKYVPVPQLVLFPSGSGAILAWAFEVSGLVNDQPFSRSYRINATSAAILEMQDEIEALTGSGTGVLGDTKTFNVERSSVFAILWWSKFNMVQEASGNATQITTYSYKAGGNTLIQSKDKNAWDPVGPEGAGAAVDGHANIQTVDQFYRNVIGRASIDGRGSALSVIVHDPNAVPYVAYFDGNDNTMHFIDQHDYTAVAPALGVVKASSAALDVCGHELTHGVTKFTSKLPVPGEGGGLNESMSDIFGTYIEAYKPPPGASTYDIGEAIVNGGLRNLQDPTSKQCGAFGACPDNWKLLQGQANIDSHTYANVSNNAWYLMTNGGTNKTSQLPVNKSLGWDSSRNLWWATETSVLHSASLFVDLAHDQTLYAHNNGFDVSAVGCAWVATGVIDAKYMKDNYQVQCYCDDGDGGVQKPDQMACCEAGATDQCCKQCTDAGDGGSTDGGGGPVDGGAKTQPDLFDSCQGRTDGVYCSELASYSSIICKNGSIAGGMQCANEAKCIGPNGAGATVQCEGQPAAPPPSSGSSSGSSGSSSGGPDSCAGKTDGLYCSTLAPYSAYQCTNQSLAGGAQCPTGKTCAGPNGPGQIVCQ